MRETLPELLRCPHCLADGTLRLAETRERDSREVREGALRCGACDASYAIGEGIVELLIDPPGHVLREAEGLERFADYMRADGWDSERVKQLPYLDYGDAYWYGQATSFRQLGERVTFRPGERLLDVGANTCWASRLFAERGLEVIALDITKTEMQGLRTADYFIRDGEIFFERVLSTMTAPAVASGVLDYVFCCEVLHHNDVADLNRTVRECYRMLKPGGALLVINEPMRYPLKLKRDHAAEVAVFAGNEHVHFFHQYVLAARRAGFKVTLRPPRYDPFFSAAPSELPLGLSRTAALREITLYLNRRSRVGRAVVYAWKSLIGGDLSLNMICRKPGPADRA